MSLEDIARIVPQIKKQCDYIYLHVLGEPLLHPDFDGILDLLDEYDLKLQLVTNGTLLNRKPDLLSHKCLRKLSISLHSISDVEVSRQYFDSINSLIEHNDNTIIELRFYDEDSLSDKLKEYRDSLIDKYGTTPTRIKNCLMLKENVYLAKSDFFKWPMIDDEVLGFDGYCHGGKDMVAILHNGDVTLCCLDPKGHNAFGNVFKEDLADILQSKEYTSYLDGLKKHKLYFDLCSRCSYRLRFDGNRS